MSYESLPCLYQVPWIFDTSKLELMKVINTPMLEREPVAIAAKKRKSGASEPEKAGKKKRSSSKLTKEQVPLPDEPAAFVLQHACRDLHVMTRLTMRDTSVFNLDYD
jgi:hypothetical protein